MNAPANNHPWRRFLRSLVATPLRAGLTLVVIIIVLTSGVIFTLISILFHTLFVVLIVLAFFAFLYRYIIHGKIH